MIGPITAFRFARAVYRIVDDPTNLDEVFVLADMSEKSDKLADVIAELRKNPALAPILEAKPRLGPVDQDALAELPEGSVGYEYASFMRKRGLQHEDLQLIDGDEKDMDWIRNHLRETHDLWHVVTGFDTDVAGELGLQAFYLAQIDGPLPVMLLAVGMTNTLFKGMHDAQHRLRAISRGYVLGSRARSLFGLRFAERWSQPLAELREELALDIEQVEAFLDVTPPEEILAKAA